MFFTSDRVQKAYLLICFMTLLPFVVVGVLRDQGMFEFIELKTLDGRLRLTRTRSQQISPLIALIPIDAKSESKEGIGPLPWPPDIYAPLLKSLQTVHPTAIGLMIWFNREWEDEQLLPGEKLFVIQPYYSVTDSANRRHLPDVTEWNNLSHSLTHAQGVSFSVFPLSRSDGIHRSAQLVVKDRTAGDYRYSLEMLILCQTYGVPPASIKVQGGFWCSKYLELSLPSGNFLRIPLDSQGRLFIRFAGDVSAFQSTPFVDALTLWDSDPAEFQQKFEEKCILIGITTEGVPKASTPFGEMSALALRANLLNTLLNRDFIWQLSRKVDGLYLTCLAILSIAAAILVYRLKRGYRSMLLIAGGLLLFHLLFVLATFVFFNVWMEASASSLALILFGVVDSLFLGHLRLRHLLWRLQTTQDQLVRTEKEAVFGVMSARVRHELRNVLNLIRAPAEMIRNNFQKQDPLGMREHPEEIISEMDAIIGWVTKLDEMLENELSFFQKARLNLQRQDLEPIIRSARDMMQPLIDEKRIQVQLDSPEKTPALSLDADKMRFVFANLIKNACQAMPPGGKLEIGVEPRRGASPPEGITVIVRDTGTGIPADQLDRIFEPFYTTKPRGLGLGLVNVKNIVEGHGGNIRVESTVGIGTTFFIELPIRKT